MSCFHLEIGLGSTLLFSRPRPHVEGRWGAWSGLSRPPVATSSPRLRDSGAHSGLRVSHVSRSPGELLHAHPSSWQRPPGTAWRHCWGHTLHSRGARQGGGCAPSERGVPGIHFLSLKVFLLPISTTHEQLKSNLGNASVGTQNFVLRAKQLPTCFICNMCVSGSGNLCAYHLIVLEAMAHHLICIY